MNYKVGTRGSRLALAQAEFVCSELKKAYPQHDFEINVISTKGDRIQNKPLNQIGDKGLFVKEIEEQLLTGTIQIAVHSMKDMPALPAPDLLFTKAWKREDPRDILILKTASSLDTLPEGAVLGTGSKRREVQLKKLRPDLHIVDIRGNVDTRIRKMEEQGLDGIVLAAAGLHRLHKKEWITQYLTIEEMIPAPAQGVLALEIRQEDKELLEMLNALSDKETSLAVKAERGFLQEMGADCHVPVGAVCQVLEDEMLRLRAIFGKGDTDSFGIAEIYGRDPVNMAKEAARQIRRQLAGTVSLTGGGPGDPGLITVKGWKAIQEADCIVYDKLSSPELLQEAREGCELIYAGKENRHHTMKQEEINKLLACKAMEYKKVVRLKGGDPYVFGRGGEEGLYLNEMGIPFEVIPGVSSAIAGLAYAGIPITHRGISGGFHVVTAHDRKDELADIDFKAMASGKETSVFLMGLGKLPEITDRLIKAGMSPVTPAAVISNATTPQQKVCSSDLEHLAEEAASSRMESPALIVVGKVVELREKLDFLQHGVLSGKRYLIPKIGEETTAMAIKLREAGADVDEIMVGKIVFKETSLTDEFLEKQDWLVFTSKHGVEAFFANLLREDRSRNLPDHCRVASVGEKTAICLQKYGCVPQLVPAEFNGEALADAMIKILKDTDKVCCFGAEETEEAWKLRLRDFCHFQEYPLYTNFSTELEPIRTLSLTAYNGIICTCASSARRLLDNLQAPSSEDWKQKIRIYSIGPKTTLYLKKYGLENIFQSKDASYDSLIECVISKERGCKKSPC